MNSEAGNIRPTVGTPEISASRTVSNRDERRRRRREKEEADDERRRDEPDEDVVVELSDGVAGPVDDEQADEAESSPAERVDYLA